MFRGIVSRRALVAVLAGALYGVGCGGTAGAGELSLATAPQPAISSVSAPSRVAAGRYHGMALRGGIVLAWGHNTSGQLGDGTTTSRITPAPVQELTGTPVSVAAGETHSLALRSDGTVWAWGWNSAGQLGNGAYTASSLPVQVQNLTGVVAISSEAFSGFSVALRSDGTVWAWGYNGSGQLGDGSTLTRNTPVQVQVANPEDPLNPYLSGVVAISAGSQHALAVRSDGSVWAWGYNATGQLGDGTIVSRSKAAPAVGLPATAVDVEAGSDFSLVLLSDGTVYTFGNNSDRQLGYERYDANNNFMVANPTPGLVTQLTGVTRIAGGRAHSMALDSAGRVWSWGTGSYGVLGHGGSSTASSANPVQALNVSAPREVAAGEHFSLVMDDSQGVWSWGTNGQKQLGRLTEGVSYISTPNTVSF